MSGTASTHGEASSAGRRRIAARNSAQPRHRPHAPIGGEGDGEGELPRGSASLQELLDHIWHYQSLVSPAFPIAAAAHAIAAGSDGGLPSADLDTDTNTNTHTHTHTQMHPSPLRPADCGYVSLASLLHNSSSPPSSRHPPAACGELAAMPGTDDEIEPPYLQHPRLRLSHIFRFVRNLQIIRSASGSASASPSCRDSVRRSAVAPRQIGAVAA